VFFHVGPPASWLADELLPDPDLLDVVHPVLLVPFDPVELAVYRPLPFSVVASTGWLQAQLEPGNSWFGRVPRAENGTRSCSDSALGTLISSCQFSTIAAILHPFVRLPDPPIVLRKFLLIPSYLFPIVMV
jgi:hypothetical protein